MRHETIGYLEFEDKANNLKCIVRFGNNKKKPSDYVDGVILRNDNPVSRMEGTYLGYIDFDG